MEPEEYQQKMHEQYETTAKFRVDESEVRLRQEFYDVDAATEFKQTYWPADPFDGVLVDANYLDMADLVTLYKAMQALKNQGNQVFASLLIAFEQSQRNDWKAIARVNPLWLDLKKQRNLEICELLQDFYFGSNEEFLEKRQEILQSEDKQLLEMLGQVEEALELTDVEMEVME